MTIRDPEKFNASHWDYGFLDDCFPGKIRLTDIDGCVEINGRILWLEFKGPGSHLPSGQKIMFDRLLLLNEVVGQRVFTPIVVWGERNQPTRMQIYPGASKPTNEAKLVALVKNWVAMAQRGKRLAREDVDALAIVEFIERCGSLDLLNDLAASLRSRLRILEDELLPRVVE